MRGNGYNYWRPWRVGRLRFEIGWCDKNYHDNRNAIAAGWTDDVACETVYGWHVSSVKIIRGRRFLLYMPSGAWWHFDVQTAPKPLT